MSLGYKVLCAYFDGKRYKNLCLLDGKLHFVWWSGGQIDHVLTTHTGNEGDNGGLDHNNCVQKFARENAAN